MNKSAVSFLMLVLALVTTASGCNDREEVSPSCNATKPYDRINLNFVGTSHKIKIENAGGFTPVTNNYVKATAYVLTRQGVLYVISGGNLKTDMNGQVDYQFALPARVVTNDVDSLAVQFVTYPNSKDVYSATLIAGYNDIMNLLNYSYTSKLATFDQQNCKWSGADFYDVVYNGDVYMDLAPPSQQRLAAPASNSVEALKAKATKIIEIK